MYELLEIEHAERYRPKFPISGQNELNANILQTKKLISGDIASSQAGASKASQSAVSSVIARLTSNPPARDRSSVVAASQRVSNKDFVKDMRQNARGKTQTRPSSLLSPAPSAQNLQTIKKINQVEPLLPISSHSHKPSLVAVTGRNGG